MIMLGQEERFLNGSLIKRERTTKLINVLRIRTSWDLSRDPTLCLSLSLSLSFSSEYKLENFPQHLTHQLSPDLHPVIRQLVEWDDEPTCSKYEKRELNILQRNFVWTNTHSSSLSLSLSLSFWRDQCKQGLLAEENRLRWEESEWRIYIHWMVRHVSLYPGHSCIRERIRTNYSKWSPISIRKERTLPSFLLEKNNSRGIK